MSVKIKTQWTFQWKRLASHVLVDVDLLPLWLSDSSSKKELNVNLILQIPNQKTSSPQIHSQRTGVQVCGSQSWLPAGSPRIFMLNSMHINAGFHLCGLGIFPHKYCFPLFWVAFRASFQFISLNRMTKSFCFSSLKNLNLSRLASLCHACKGLPSVGRL